MGIWVPTLLDLLEERLHLVNSFFPLFSQKVPQLGPLLPPAYPMRFSPNPLFPSQNIYFLLSWAAWVLLNANQILLLLSLKPFPKAHISQVKPKTSWAIIRGPCGLSLCLTLSPHFLAVHFHETCVLSRQLAVLGSSCHFLCPCLCICISFCQECLSPLTNYQAHTHPSRPSSHVFLHEEVAPHLERSLLATIVWISLIVLFS